MAAVRSKGTRPEMLVRKELHRLGFRYRLHRVDLPGRPDLTFSTARAVVEVRGCFWHQHCGCKRARLPSTRVEWWTAKLKANVERDWRNEGALANLGWRTLVAWECELIEDADAVIRRLVAALRA